ncbi:MAG: hypothetical protein H7Z73_10045 [Candidatus Saccharibacteria bacterium]|nr:hypothetical protein [Moraxellaceae bacterium]
MFGGLDMYHQALIFGILMNKMLFLKMHAQSIPVFH